MKQVGEYLLPEMFGTFSLSVGSAVRNAIKNHENFIDQILYFCNEINLNTFCVIPKVGMEFWARWAHRALWHASLWQMHEVSPTQLPTLII